MRNYQRDIPDFEICEQLFKMCYAGGGDGDVTLVSPNFKEWADKFERWISIQDKTHYGGFHTKDYNNYVVVSREQENVWFVSPARETELPIWSHADGKIVLDY